MATDGCRHVAHHSFTMKTEEQDSSSVYTSLTFHCPCATLPPSLPLVIQRKREKMMMVVSHASFHILRDDAPRTVLRDA